MSQTTNKLKSIAVGEEYKSLCAAIVSRDYQTLYKSFTQISQLLSEARKEIEAKIDSLPRRNKEEDRQKFQRAFEMRSQTAVPQWHWINSKIKKQNIIEGVVVSIGKMGDPITRTPSGKLVALSGSKAKEGDNVVFTIVSAGPKIDFGQQFELTPNTLQVLLNQEVYQKVKDSLDIVEKKLESFPITSDADNLSRLDEMLKTLEEASELAAKMLDSERERVLNRVMTHRRRLLGSMVEKLAVDLVFQEEEKAIKELCGDDEEQVAMALTAPGLFHPQALLVFKEELFDGDKLRGYEKILEKREKHLDTMDSAMKFEDFKASINKLQPKAKQYIDSMEQLFQGLHFIAKQLTTTIINDNTDSSKAILGKIREAFSEKALGDELRHVFRNTKDYFDMREAAIHLKAKLGDTECTTAEALLKPYLLQKVNRAFG
jgi:hypothetical protein